MRSVNDAMTCALSIQEHAARVAETAANPIRHRIGVHMGDEFVAEDDVLGDGVNVAARLLDEAEPNSICVSRTVYEMVKKRPASAQPISGRAS